MDVKRAVSIASFLGGLFYTGLSYAQEAPAQETSGFSQPHAEEPAPVAAPQADSPVVPEAPTAQQEKCPACPQTMTALAKRLRTGRACATTYGKQYACVAPSVADTLGLTNRVENKDRRNYTKKDADACPSQQVCAGPIENQEELAKALKAAEQEKSNLESRIKELEGAKTELDDFDSFVLGLKENCRGAYDQFNAKLDEVKSNYSTAIVLGKRIREIFSAEGEEIELTPGQALQQRTSLPESPPAIGDLLKQYDAAGDKYQKSKTALDKERERLKKEGCGQTKVIEKGGQFKVSPFVRYLISVEAENQGVLGISTGYQTGRWTFGGRAAAILQYVDTDSDTDKSNEQTAALPGGVQKTTSHVTKTTTEEKDYAAVGPAVTYSIGRVDLSAGLDALIGQKRTRKDYTGYMDLTKDGQALDGKKQVYDSTTQTETQFGAYPHANLDVRLWKGLSLSAEGGYNTRSKSPQGGLGIIWKF